MSVWNGSSTLAVPQNSFFRGDLTEPRIHPTAIIQLDYTQKVVNERPFSVVSKRRICCMFWHHFNPTWSGLFEDGSAWGRGGGVPAAYNSKTINDNEVKFGGEVENH